MPTAKPDDLAGDELQSAVDQIRQRHESEMREQ